MKKAKGFSLIELLIVVAIILIIAAMAIPNLLRSRIAANEASAISTLRLLNTAELTYSTAFGSGYTDDLAKLGPPAVGTTPTFNSADLVDLVLAGGTAGSAPPAPAGSTFFVKSGYLFTYTPNGAFPAVAGYTITSSPVS